MNFTELAKQRFSVRSFKPDALDEKQLDEILEAGRLAPTAKNFQPYHIYVSKARRPEGPSTRSPPVPTMRRWFS